MGCSSITRSPPFRYSSQGSTASERLVVPAAVGSCTFALAESLIDGILGEDMWSVPPRAVLLKASLCIGLSPCCKRGGRREGGVFYFSLVCEIACLGLGAPGQA